MNELTRYAPEVRDRAVRMVLEHRDEYPWQWAAIESVVGKIGCKAETLRQWLRQPNGIPVFDPGRRRARPSASSSWSARFGSSGKPTRSCGRRQRVAAD